MFAKTKDKSLMIIVPVVTALVAGTVWFLLKPDDSGTQAMISLSPVSYDSFAEAQQGTDATLRVTVISEPKRFTDFGIDGSPDHADDSGLPLELIDARVEEVLHGDEALLSQTITIAQLPEDIVDSHEAGQSMVSGQSYVILATRNVANPGVGVEGELWSPLLANQGVFAVDAQGMVSAFSPEVFPEVFGDSSQTPVTTEDLISEE